MFNFLGNYMPYIDILYLYRRAHAWQGKKVSGKLESWKVWLPFPKPQTSKYTITTPESEINVKKKLTESTL